MIELANEETIFCLALTQHILTVILLIFKCGQQRLALHALRALFSMTRWWFYQMALMRQVSLEWIISLLKSSFLVKHLYRKVFISWSHSDEKFFFVFLGVPELNASAHRHLFILGTEASAVIKLVSLSFHTCDTKKILFWVTVVAKLVSCKRNTLFVHPESAQIALYCSTSGCLVTYNAGMLHLNVL